MNQPYIHFYPRDWLAEYKLRMLSPADRGVWIDLLCLMAMAEPYGHLALNGKPMTDDAVCRILGVDVATYKATLARLVDVGVCSTNGNGEIYSRRMVRDYERRTNGEKYGKRGGNPALKDSKDKPISNTITITRETLRGRVKGDPYGLFNEFWKLYPNKTGKGAARKAFEKMKCKDAMEIIKKAIESQAKSDKWTKDGGQYIPNPATWLNQERWLDESFIPIRPRKPHSDPKTAIRDRAVTEIMARLKTERLATPEESFMEIAARLALGDKYRDIPGAVDKAVWTLNYERKA